MKKFFAAVVFALAFSSFAQWKPGQGVANDHARGANPHDIQFVQRGGGNGYGYRTYDVPIGFTFLPWSFPNFESTVKGVRLNLGWGSYAGTYGLDLGTFSASGDFAGVSANWLGNYVSGRAAGVQVGLVNAGGFAQGLQIGLVNHVDRLEGVQIGLLNFATTQWSIPLVNVCW